MRQHRGAAQRQPEQDQPRVRAQLADLQRGAQPDEEQRAEEALGDAEQLAAQPARLAHRGEHQPEGKPGQHDRDVRADRHSGQREQQDQADPQFQGQPAAFGVAVQPLAPAVVGEVAQQVVEQHRAGSDGQRAQRRAAGPRRVDHQWQQHD